MPLSGCTKTLGTTQTTRRLRHLRSTVSCVFARLFDTAQLTAHILWPCSVVFFCMGARSNRYTNDGIQLYSPFRSGSQSYTQDGVQPCSRCVGLDQVVLTESWLSHLCPPSFGHTRRVVHGGLFSSPSTPYPKQQNHTQLLTARSTPADACFFSHPQGRLPLERHVPLDWRGTYEHLCGRTTWFDTVWRRQVSKSLFVG